MKISVGSNEQFNEIRITKNDNSNDYQVYIDGLVKKNGDQVSFKTNCSKCKDIKLEFDILKDSEIKVLENEGTKS